MGLRENDWMSADDFLLWEGEQELRYELVDGAPMMMVGGTAGHDMIIMNASAYLHGKLRGTRCRVHSAGMKLRCPNDNIRYPDITLACGRVEPSDILSSDPRVVFEVLSPSTKSIDFLIKLRDYKTIPTLSAYVILWQNEPRALVHRRSDLGWTEEEVTGLDGVIALPEVEVTLPLAETYDGLPPPKPRARSRK